MKKHMHVAAATGLVALVAALAAASPAAAATAPQVFHTNVNVPPFDTDVCGFAVSSVVQGTDTTQVFVDRFGNVSIQDASHIISTLTNKANHKVVYVESAGRDRFPESPVPNPDGTFTAIDTLTGSPARIYTSHSSVLVKDVGFLSIVDTLDADGNLISEQIIIHGVHQVSGPNDPAYCAAITSAIG